MRSIQQKVCVEFRYAVHFTSELFAPENPLFKNVVRQDGAASRKEVLFILDQEMAAAQRGLSAAIKAYGQHHSAHLKLVSPPLLVPGGEFIKNDPSSVTKIHEAINQAGLCRHSYVAAIGGGSVLDAVGYAAATAHRGVRLIRIPTTVLAQNDSGVGVKNGVNAFGKKNFLGTFAPPFAVINDSQFLVTLTDRVWRSGLAEAIKVALIKDPAFFAFIEQQVEALLARDMGAMQQLIYRCAELHLDHIANQGDPFEMGASRPLDFGHWAAHKLEQLTAHRLLHGEAVAMGIALDATYSHLTGLLPETDWRRIIGLLSAAGFALYLPELHQASAQSADRPAVLEGLNEFREHLGGQLTIMLLKGIGDGIEVHQIDEPVMTRSISWLRPHGATMTEPRPEESLVGN